MPEKRTYSLDEIKAFKEAFGEKHDTSSTTPSIQPPHGPFPGNNSQFGPFSGAGVRPGMYGALARVDSIGRVIPFQQSRNYNELIEILTGVTEGSGNNATSSGADAPKAGEFKVMRRQSQFGIIHEGVHVADVTQAGMRRDYADVDREVYNLTTRMNPLLPQVPGIDGSGATSTTLRGAMYRLGVDIERNTSPVHFVGVSGTEDNAYRGVARQWDGLDQLIATGYTDFVTGVPAEAVDSVVNSYNANITGTNASGRNFVNALTDLVYSLVQRAEDVTFPGVTWALVMRRDLFREAAIRFAADLPTYTSLGTTAAPMNREGMEVTRMFNDMFDNQYLLIDGQRIGVVLDNSIPRDTLGNDFYKSDIYMVPLTGLGRNLTYIQYFDMANPEATELATGVGIPDMSTTVNNGLYRVFKRQTKGMLEYDVYARIRMILEAPFLAGRLDDVWYNRYTDERDPLPGQSFYANGGVTYRS